MPDLTKQREGLRLASTAQLCVLTQLQDKRLHARIYEGFLLPYLTAASPQKWQDISRHSIVEGATSAYAGSGETDKQIALLRFYLDMTARAAADQDDADWARAQLATTLAGQGKYGEAIPLLQAIQSPRFAARQLIPDYQRQWDKQKQSDKQKQQQLKPSISRPAMSPGDNQ